MGWPKIFGGIAEDIKHPQKPEQPQKKRIDERQPRDYHWATDVCPGDCECTCEPSTCTSIKPCCAACTCSTCIPDCECDYGCGCAERDCSKDEPCCDDCDCDTCGAGPYVYVPDGYENLKHIVFLYDARTDDDWASVKCTNCDWEVDGSSLNDYADGYLLAYIHELRELLKADQSAQPIIAMSNADIDSWLESIQRRAEEVLGL